MERKSSYRSIAVVSFPRFPNRERIKAHNLAPHAPHHPMSNARGRGQICQLETSSEADSWRCLSGNDRTFDGKGLFPPTIELPPIYARPFYQRRTCAEKVEYDDGRFLRILAIVLDGARRGEVTPTRRDGTPSNGPWRYGEATRGSPHLTPESYRCVVCHRGDLLGFTLHSRRGATGEL